MQRPYNLLPVLETIRSGQPAKCPRCAVTVDADKINLPGRCGDKLCPLDAAMRLIEQERAA